MVVFDLIGFFFLLSVVQTFAGRIFDVTAVPVETMYTEAGSNVTVTCPGVTEHSLILTLEWRCRGCAQGFPLSSSSHSSISSSQEVKLVEYRSESTTIWQNRHRMTLLSQSSALLFHPVMATDSGEYYCLVNNRPKPEAIVRLIVQDVADPPGRPLTISFTSRAVNLSWAPPLDTHNSAILHYIIHVRVGEEGEWDETSPTGSGIVTETNQTSYQLVGLQPYTVYSFRVVAVSAMGKSPSSKESYFMVTLREAPDGKPTITAAHNTSATSIHLSWRAPHKDSINGEFLGYRIAFRPRDTKGPDLEQEVYLRDPNIDSHTIQNLDTFTQYLVSLQVFNPEGLGPKSVVAVMTDEGVPSKPLNVTAVQSVDGRVTITWSEPDQPNGVIKGYRLYYMHKNYTDVSTIRTALPEMEYVLQNLEPFTDYKIWLKAFTWKNEGESSSPVVVLTDVRGPSAPHLTNVTCQSHDTLFLQWKRPPTFYHSIDYYYIYYRNEKSWEFEELPVETASDRFEHMMFIPNLTTNTLYEVKVRGGTKSLFHLNTVYKGIMSEAKKVFLEVDCDKIQHILVVHPESEISAGIIAGVACAGFALLLGIAALIMWRRCFQASYYYLDDPPRVPQQLMAVDWDMEVGADGCRTAIPVHLFPKHVTELHADGDIGFSKEYEAIQAASSQEEFASEHSLHPENKQKNRYMNIVAYDHSRVQLAPMPGQKKPVDYVNANYIDGFQKYRAYIGTQGPLPSTFDCFWRMVWEQHVCIIVMITNLVERGRKKCDMYWPKEGVETYGVIQVKLIREDVLATYTIRTLQIKHLKIRKKKQSSCERLVYQYHYTNWPDHGVPDHPVPVLSFVKKSAAANPPDGGPIIVHCSAGVGRTGTYIVLDALLRQVSVKGEMSVFGFLRHIRTQRNFLVQTEEQYIFIHDALLEAIDSGDTCIHKSHLTRYIQALQATDYSDGKSDPWRMLEHQFKLVTLFQAKDYQMLSALKPSNLPKNRGLEILPIESHRVHLTPKPGVDGSDYINGTWMQGFHRLKEFILTQHPMESTSQDFWQMVWDHNAQTVVVLSAVDDHDCCIFWPSELEDFDSENYRVHYVDESVQMDCIVRSFSVQSLQDDYQLSVRLIHCPGWPHHCTPLTSSLELLRLVEEKHSEYQNGPIIVIDRYGGTEGATFCCLTALWKQLDFEQYVDVYSIAKLYHFRRPGIWKSQDDYLLLYRAIDSFVTFHNSTSSPSQHSPLPLPPPPIAPPMPNTNGHPNGFIGMNGNGYLGIPSGNGMAIRIPPDGTETILKSPAAETV